MRLNIVRGVVTGLLTQVELPLGCQVVESIRYGTAAWTRAARISVRLEDGQSKSYFVKVCESGSSSMVADRNYSAPLETMAKA